MRDHTLLQAIARVNRPYENEQAEMVKPHGFVLDFVGIFDKLEKALAFDSEEVNAIVKDLKLLKVLFQSKMEQQAPDYLSLIERNFDDKDVDTLIEHFRDPERRKTFFREYKEIEMLYEIISPDAFLRPWMDDYGTLSAIYDVVRKAYARQVQVDRAFQKKTSELVQQHVGTDYIQPVSEVLEINEQTVEYIVARKGGFRVDAAVIVATIRALKVHGGVPLEEVKQENVEAVRKGYENLQKHIENLRIFGVPAVVAINRFPTDTEAEIRALEELLEQEGVPYSLVEVHSRGGEGGIDLAEKVVKLAESGNSDMKFLYELDEDLKTKIEKISKAMYGAEGVDFTDEARKKLRLYERRGYGGLYINMAKTQYSLSDNPKVLGRPRNFRVKVTDAVLLAGAGFVVPILGGINLMPGLPRHPNALDITMDDEGNIEGLF